MEIIKMKLSEIRPYKNNPRKNDKGVEKVATSIKTFGFKVPVIVDKKGEIVAGHTRVKAAEKLGMEEIPCIVADDLTQEQIRAFRIADNRVAEESEWDIDLLNLELEEIDLFTGFEEDEIDLFESTKDIEDLLDDYKEPEKKALCCPQCGYEGEKREFEK